MKILHFFHIWEKQMWAGLKGSQEADISVTTAQIDTV